LETLVEKDSNNNINKTRVDIMLVDKEGNTNKTINLEVEIIIITEAVEEVETEVVEVVTKEEAICNKCPTNSTHNNKHSNNLELVSATPRCNNKMFRGIIILNNNNNKSGLSNNQFSLLFLNMMLKLMQELRILMRRNSLLVTVFIL
jgi:hypothetical protein